MSLSINRRRLLMTAAAGALGSLAAPFLAAAATAATSAPVSLIAGRRTLDIDGRAATVFGITQRDGTHGLFTEAGTPFRVTLRNDAGVDTLIHWHGLTPPYQQDGVPGLSAPVILPGGTAHYDFPLKFSGTFWMHSHQGLQEQALMSAPLIIREGGNTMDRQEVVLMLHDFSFRSPEEIFAGLRHAAGSGSARPMQHMDGMSDMPGMAMEHSAKPSSAMKKTPAAMKMDLNDVAYDALLANDRTLADPQVVRIERKGRVLLRIINGAAASNFRIDLGPVKAELIAVDGHAVAPVIGSQFSLAMAQRIDLLLDLTADHPAVPVLAILEGERKQTGIILATPGAQIRKLGTLASVPAPAIDFQMERQLRAATPLAAKSADRVHHIALTGTMAGYVWSLNGLTYGDDKPLMVAKGQRVELVMANKTMMSHPMHLHGHAFQVVAIDSARFNGAIRDTVLVPPMRTVTVAFDADNPGRWAFHCHNLYHMAAGMMTTVQYETF